jgi:hypothetical protein
VRFIGPLAAFVPWTGPAPLVSAQHG